MHSSFLLSDVSEFHILSFLDLSSILSISCLSKNYNTFINESQIVWEDKLMNYFKKGTNYDPILINEMKFYLSKLNIPILLKNNNILQTNYKNIFYVFHYLFTFSKKGFLQSDTVKSFTSTFYPTMNKTNWDDFFNIQYECINENGKQNSIIGYFNGNHTVMACHKKPRGNWETIIANKECTVGNIYYWTIHLTRYEPKNSGNAWTILIGVDDLLNCNRNNQTKQDLHYRFGAGKSNGFGYGIKPDDYVTSKRGCSYSESNVNNVNDYVGVCFDFRNYKNIKLTFYINNGEGKRENSIDLEVEDENTLIFRPAVSIVGWQGVSILPWDGNVEVLREMKKLKL
ncbi:hypothetical protein ABK040_015727 [Willaertia magna]